MAVPRVLVVDDDDDLRDAIRLGLEEVGYVVDSCGTASSARDLILLIDYDYLLVDYSIDDESGPGLVTFAMAKVTPPRCVVMSGYKLPSAPDYTALLKPFDVDDLLRSFPRKPHAR